MSLIYHTLFLELTIVLEMSPTYPARACLDFRRARQSIYEMSRARPPLGADHARGVPQSSITYNHQHLAVCKGVLNASVLGKEKEVRP